MINEMTPIKSEVRLHVPLPVQQIFHSAGSSHVNLLCALNLLLSSLSNTSRFQMDFPVYKESLTSLPRLESMKINLQELNVQWSLLIHHQRRFFTFGFCQSCQSFVLLLLLLLRGEEEKSVLTNVPVGALTHQHHQVTFQIWSQISNSVY